MAVNSGINSLPCVITGKITPFQTIHTGQSGVEWLLCHAYSFRDNSDMLVSKLWPRLCLVRNVIDMQLIILYLTKHPVLVTNPVQNKLQGKPLGKHGFLNLLIVRLVSLIPSK